jgi:hypothetical protein
MAVIALKKEQEAAAAAASAEQGDAAVGASPPSLPPSPPPSADDDAVRAAGLNWSSRPADVIAFHQAQANEIANATVVITGPTSGIGVHTAESLASVCGRVVLAARSEARALSLISDIQSRLPKAQLSFVPLDLTSLDSVAACASAVLERQRTEGWPPLKALILNAGVYTFSGRYESSQDGYERTFAVNVSDSSCFTSFSFSFCSSQSHSFSLPSSPSLPLSLPPSPALSLRARVRPCACFGLRSTWRTSCSPSCCCRRSRPRARRAWWWWAQAPSSAPT